MGQHAGLVPVALSDHVRAMGVEESPEASIEAERYQNLHVISQMANS